MKRRLLWVGDAACDSGFARATQYAIEGLRDEWDVHVLGINYRGDPHAFPYPIYPAWPGGDLFGIGRLPELIRKLKPEVVVILNDPWNIPAYVQAIEQVKEVPRPQLLGWIAVDGKNCRGWALNGLDRVVFWTKFAEYEAIRGGLNKPSAIVPLGVDLNIYKPGDRLQARRDLGLPEFCQRGFIVGNVNRNQPRKRLDLTIQCFADWIHSRGIDDAYLYLHVAPTGDLGYDCNQLAAYYNLHQRIILATPEVYKGASERMLAATYQAFDVQVNTGVGEGWGLTTLEGMAAGIPQVVGDWSALGEWAKDVAFLIPCEPVCSLNKVNVIGGLVDRKKVVEALDVLYTVPGMRQGLSELGIALAAKDCYRWKNIAATFAEEVRKVADPEYAEEERGEADRHGGDEASPQDPR